MQRADQKATQYDTYASVGGRESTFRAGYELGSAQRYRTLPPRVLHLDFSTCREQTNLPPIKYPATIIQNLVLAWFRRCAWKYAWHLHPGVFLH